MKHFSLMDVDGLTILHKNAMNTYLGRSSVEKIKEPRRIVVENPHGATSHTKFRKCNKFNIEETRDFLLKKVPTQKKVLEARELVLEYLHGRA